MSPKRDKTTQQREASSDDELRQEHVPLSYESDADLNLSGLTLAAEVPVQSLGHTLSVRISHGQALFQKHLWPMPT